MIVQPEGWPRPSGYANGIVAAGRVLAVAGQVGWDPHTQAIVAPDFVSQARQALTNVVAVVRAAGGQPHHVVRLTWYITSHDAYASAGRELGRAYRDVFGGHYPAMSVVVVAGLIESGALLEIEALAVLDPA
jgi:enamine deaminase RidA (YjgF/YER057c/UK114 family)